MDEWMKIRKTARTMVRLAWAVLVIGVMAAIGAAVSGGVGGEASLILGGATFWGFCFGVIGQIMYVRAAVEFNATRGVKMPRCRACEKPVDWVDRHGWCESCRGLPREAGPSDKDGMVSSLEER